VPHALNFAAARAKTGKLTAIINRYTILRNNKDIIRQNFLLTFGTAFEKPGTNNINHV
jgi:hypothetical protein